MNATYYRLEVLRFVRDRVGLFFTVGIPLFMYLVFGAAQSFGKENAGHGNVTFYIMVSMAAYGAVTATTGIGASAATERNPRRAGVALAQQQHQRHQPVGAHTRTFPDTRPRMS